MRSHRTWVIGMRCSPFASNPNSTGAEINIDEKPRQQLKGWTIGYNRTA
jgi:hypothetical protein